MKKTIGGLLLVLLLVFIAGCALAAGVLDAQWKNQNGEWICMNASGAPVTSFRGYAGVRIPAEVDRLSIKDFAGADRKFVIYCEPDSYAQSFALSHGLQYDNGVKRVVGYDIRNLNQKVSWIIENYITSDMSDGQKAKVLHNWLVFNNYYDLSLSRGDPSDVLLYGTGVCQAYAEAYALLLTKVGVENRTLISSTEMNHIWNIVKIGNRWVHIDATWDDPVDKKTQFAISGNEDEAYYALGDADMAQDHDWEETLSVDTGYVGFVYAYSHTYYYGPNGQRTIGWAILEVPDHVYNRQAQGYVLYYETKTFYFDETGDITTGWKMIGGVPYYFQDDGAWDEAALLSGWAYLDHAWYYIYGGTALTGWQQMDGFWYYFAGDGAMATEWTQVGTDWYYFTENGAMVTGWMETRNKAGQSLWYYFQDSGTRTVGWRQIDGSWYYFSPEGVMATGLQQIGGETYLFQSSGAMTTGWAQQGSAWYYLQKSGAAARGWLQIDGVWYYFDASGVMQTGTQTIDGQVYSFTASGAWIP